MARAPRITINLSADERKKLQALAAVNERSIAGEARIAIKQYVEAAAVGTGKRRAA